MSSYIDALKRWRLQEQRRPRDSHEPASPASTAAQLDRLHERLRIVANHASLRVLAFAGVSGGEGTGAIALGFAEHLGKEARRVLLVLGDVHTLRPGGSAPMEDLARLVADGTSPVLPGGAGVAVVGPTARSLQAAQLLNGEAFAAWVSEQASRFDNVILEAPPVLKYSEASSLAQLANGVVLVVRARATQVADVAQARRELERVPARILGVVLSHVEAPPPFLRRVLMPEAATDSQEPNEAAG